MGFWADTMRDSALGSHWTAAMEGRRHLHPSWVWDPWQKRRLLQLQEQLPDPPGIAERRTGTSPAPGATDSRIRCSLKK